MAVLNSLAMDHGAKAVCTQPGCLLKRAGFNVEHLAKFLIQTLAGECMEGIVLESERILARPQCTHCALRVMQGRKAYLTEAEWSHLDDLGGWHHRRQRRKRHWGYQSH